MDGISAKVMLVNQQLDNIIKLNAISELLNKEAEQLLLDGNENKKDEVLRLSNEFERLSNSIMDCGKSILKQNQVAN